MENKLEGSKPKNPVLLEGKYEEIKDDSIGQLRNPLKNIIGELSAGIDSGEYGLIIGEDTSGRISTLILNDVLGTLYKEKGYDEPKTVFVTGSGGSGGQLDGIGLEVKMANLAMYIKDVLSKQTDTEKFKKVLISTETIQKGYSLLPLVQVLRELGLDFDIVSIGIEKTKSLDDIQKLLGTKIYYGMRGTPDVKGQRGLSGVDKTSENFISKSGNINLFSKPFKKSLPEDEKTSLQQSINLARKDVKNLSRELVDWYKASSV